MAIDLNMDIGDLVKSLLKKDGGASAAMPGGEKDQISGVVVKIMPFKNAIIIIIAAIITLSLYLNMYYQPMQEQNLKKDEEVKRLVDLQKKTEGLSKKIIYLKSKLSESRERYVESLSHFGNSEDLGELYQSVSTLAAKYDLAVLNIKETTPPPPPPEMIRNAEGVEVPVVKTNQTEVKEIQVEIELKGRYSEYVKFKEDLAIAEILLKVNSENIKVKTDKGSQGMISVKLSLSTFAIDKKPFQAVINENESK